MQAADLLAVVAPVANAKGGPFSAQGKGAGVFGVGAAQGEGQGADAQGVDGFAQALAAMLAAAGQMQQQQPQQQAAAEGEGEDVTDAQGVDPSAGKSASAFAANLKGQAKQAAASEQATTPSATDAAATVETAQTPEAGQAATVATDADQTAQTKGQAKGEPAHTLPETAKADEALDRRLASPLPRSDRAQEVAKGPHLPPWAAQTAPPADPAAATEVAPTTPPVEQTPTTNVATTDAATTALAGETQLAANAAPTTPQPRVDGKAKGKIDGKGDAKGKDEPPGLAHGPRGIGKGLETAPGQLKKADDDTTSLAAPAPETQTAQSGQTETTQTDVNAAALAAADQARATPAAHVENKAAAHTVAHLASQIVAKTDGAKSTRFDVQLDPAGLGKVDVKIEISRGGEISAAMTFDNPQAAAELRSRAGELRSALEQAGFDLSKGGLSFDFSGQGNGRQLWDQGGDAGGRPSWSRAAFNDLSLPADLSQPAARRSLDAGGVDVTI